MKWHQYRTAYNSHKEARRLPDHMKKPADWYKHTLYLLRESPHCRHLPHEAFWIADGRPFYNVWPSVIPGLVNVPLTLPCSSLLKPFLSLPPTLEMRFAQGQEPTCGETKIRTLLCSRTNLITPERTDGGKGFVVFCDTGEEHVAHGIRETILWDICFSLESECSVEQEIESLPLKGLQPHETQVVVLGIRIIIGVALMHSDPELVEAIVLNKDQDKYQQTRDPELVKRAKRKGLFGFNVGAKIETSPHVRREHMALFWTGPGRTIPKLQLRKGSIVKRNKLTEVPTGYSEEMKDEYFSGPGESVDRRR